MTNLIMTSDSVFGNTPEYPQGLKPSNETNDDNFELTCTPTLSSESSKDYVRTELSDLFDPEALPTSGSLDQSLGTKESAEMDKNGKDRKNDLSKKIKPKSFRRLKFKSPIKVLSRKKKKASEEDMDLFEEKEPLDLLDDDRDDREGVERDSRINPADSVLPFNLPSTSSPVVPRASVPTYSSAEAVRTPIPIQSLKNLSGNTMNGLSPGVPKIPNTNKPSGKPLSRPTPVKTDTRAKSIDKVIQMFTGPKEKENEVDLSIGLRLALPDKLDIMTGSTPIKEEQNKDTPSKKLMIVKESPLRFSKSPFKRRPAVKASYSDPKSTDKELPSAKDAADNEDNKETVLLRTSELEPSVHQVSIPEATDLLVHARICSLMEGYDKLLETRAKAGKRWFSFGNLVGLSRKDLENMYLIAIGKKPAIPMYIGDEAENLPPPLPNIVQNSFVAPRLGNPFDELGNDGHSLTSFPSTYSGESGGINSYNSKHPRARKNGNLTKEMKPHPSTIKSLLECSDDLVVEGYFNETIGNDNVLIEDIESTSVQVAVFSSQRCRQFIICYRGTIGQHCKPIRKRIPCKLDSNGVNDRFGCSYLPELEQKVFELIQTLSSENPFCDVVFTGHSFGGNLSLIAAVRCAEKYQDMTVSFHGFGISKLCQKDYRLRAHSLPNLKIIRVENCLDMYVNLPVGPWEHVGHTITIEYAKNKKRTVINPQGNEGETVSAVAKAYKFGKKEVENSTNSIHRVINTIDARNKKNQAKTDHEMRNYMHALEHFTHMGSQWVTCFANELGSGIVTKENEVRMVV